MKILILYSLPTKRALQSAYAVADTDTVTSASKIARALEKKGVTATLIGLSSDRIDETVRLLNGDLIINLIDWTGLDLPFSLSAMNALERRGIPFTGATKENFRFVDKVVMKKALNKYGIPTPAWQEFASGNEPISSLLKFPVLVKLAHEHCSIGIEKDSLVSDKQVLVSVIQDRVKRFGQPVYVEEFISGREFQITVLETETGPRMLPPAEVVYKTSNTTEFLTFTERWDEKDPLYQRSTTVLASLTPSQLTVFQTITLRIFTKLGFRDFTRVDARMNTMGDFFVLEANPNPGLDDDKLYSITMSARAAGMTFPDFLWAIVTSAVKRSRKE